MLTKIYKGERGISECHPKTPFPEYELYLFLNKHLNKDKHPSLFMAFNILDDSSYIFDTLVRAITYKIKLQFENGNSNNSETVKEIYLRLFVDKLTLINKEINAEDISFINEVNNCCPICKREKLLKNYLTHQSVRNFKIVQIYPETGLTLEKQMLFNTYQNKPSNFKDGTNLIALCPSCAALYIDSKDYNTYKKLIKIKKSIIKDALVNDAMEKYDIRDAIAYVISNLREINNINNLDTLTLQAKSIDDKIPPNNPLNQIIKVRAYQFYNYINALLSDLERKENNLATELARNIKYMSTTLINSGYEDDEIIERLAHTINDKIGGDLKTINACHCVVAYFVAHCEVLTR